MQSSRRLRFHPWFTLRADPEGARGKGKGPPSTREAVRFPGFGLRFSIAHLLHWPGVSGLQAALSNL